jgi:pyridinium-3,5-bisthiocarboxylic acid mononucleotide nickel chelatase
MKILYYDCFSGISGDMHLGAMIDLGVDPEYLIDQLKYLNLTGYEIKISNDQRKGISGTRVDVVLSDKHSHHHRGLSDISKIIRDSELDKAVKERSLKMFTKLAEAEAKIHGKSVDEVHFHEVGAVDSIVDIVGAAICIEYIQPDRIMASEVELGGGFVKCTHGTFPVPAPATSEILEGVPVRTGAVRFETTTPTGALILACNVDEFAAMKGFSIEKTAYGIGQKDLEIPNVLRVYLANAGKQIREGQNEVIPAEDHSPPDTVKAWILECNIDDMNPEMYGYVMDTLFELGASDVFITPIIMKKARPASKLSILCPPEKREELTEALLTHTTSLGVRSYEVDKTMLQRKISKLKTSYGEVTIKTAIYKGQKLKSKPEYEDCVRLAREHNIPVNQIYSEISGLINQDT